MANEEHLLLLNKGVTTWNKWIAENESFKPELSWANLSDLNLSGINLSNANLSNKALLDFKPQIVHFSGHGTGEDGLALEDDIGNLKLVDTEALAQLFKLFSSTIECVVLNACYSQVQAEAVVKYIPYVVGMNKEIGDQAAIKFAAGFYNALGAGECVEFAYKLGCNVIQLDGISEHLTPVLKKKQ
ncbi:CHAT domain-containing protein [Scytonema tolypothrichoides VB-61278]|nr:CHAT domain-containing protein [Scytonema tolypothrichoides VB-61278]